MSYSCSICDAKFWESEKLSTSTKISTKFSLCCGEGKVVLPSLDKLPELLGTCSQLLIAEAKISGTTYNSSLAFCSLGANIDKELANARRGVYTFRFQGVVHHYIGSLVPNSVRHQFLPRSTFTTVHQMLKPSETSRRGQTS